MCRVSERVSHRKIVFPFVFPFVAKTKKKISVYSFLPRPVINHQPDHQPRNASYRTPSQVKADFEVFEWNLTISCRTALSLTHTHADTRRIARVCASRCVGGGRTFLNLSSQSPKNSHKYTHVKTVRGPSQQTLASSAARGSKKIRGARMRTATPSPGSRV